MIKRLLLIISALFLIYGNSFALEAQSVTAVTHPGAQMFNLSKSGLLPYSVFNVDSNRMMIYEFDGSSAWPFNYVGRKWVWATMTSLVSAGSISQSNNTTANPKTQQTDRWTAISFNSGAGCSYAITSAYHVTWSNIAGEDEIVYAIASDGKVIKKNLDTGACSLITTLNTTPTNVGACGGFDRNTGHWICDTNSETVNTSDGRGYYEIDLVGGSYTQITASSDRPRHWYTSDTGTTCAGIANNFYMDINTNGHGMLSPDGEWYLDRCGTTTDSTTCMSKVSQSASEDCSIWGEVNTSPSPLTISPNGAGSSFNSTAYGINDTHFSWTQPTWILGQYGGTGVAQSYPNKQELYLNKIDWNSTTKAITETEITGTRQKTSYNYTGCDQFGARYLGVVSPNGEYAMWFSTNDKFTLAEKYCYPSQNPETQAAWTINDWVQYPQIYLAELGTTCTSWTYSVWGACQQGSYQVRTIVTSSPEGCTGGSPILTQDCPYDPGEQGDVNMSQSLTQITSYTIIPQGLPFIVSYSLDKAGESVTADIKYDNGIDFTGEGNTSCATLPESSTVNCTINTSALTGTYYFYITATSGTGTNKSYMKLNDIPTAITVVPCNQLAGELCVGSLTVTQ